MNQPPIDRKRVEQYIGTVLRRQPLRQAPAALEARVLQVLAHEAARPWWLRGFSRWPWPARLLFLPLGVGCVQLAYFATNRLSSMWRAVQISAPANAAKSGLQTFDNLGQALQTLGNIVTREIPSVWIYGGAGAALLLYAAMFGLGAAAFRALVITPEHARY